MILFIVIAFLLLLPIGCYGSIVIYASWQQFSLAWKVVAGQVKHEDGKFSCSRPHVEATYIAIKKEDYDSLIAAADELKIARGFAAAFERDKVTYAETVNDVLGSLSRVNKVE